jgi:predicted  nucleic acid-binding Zn-ribbon protein
MSASKIWEPGSFGLDTEQLRLVLNDVNAGHRALVEELTRRLQDAEGSRDRLRNEVEQLKKDLHDLEINQAVDANPEVIWARQKEREARERELADLKAKVHELEKQLTKSDGEKTTLTNEKGALLTERGNLQTEIVLLKAYIDLLEKAIRDAPYVGKPTMPKRPTAKAAPGAAAS